MALINGFSKKELTPDDVFTFDILLCDNQVDRDFERFSEAALYELKELFVGKTGIFDHQWSASGQKARIFRTEVVTDETKSVVSGAPYCYLKGGAYMLREGNESLIAEIEGGIKREVSVGCSMEKSVCSICGEERGSVKCGHIPGREYGGKTCYMTLEGARDAYEWSFVAVPAQKNAGVLKKYSERDEKMTLENYISQADDGIRAEFESLKSLAEKGASYMDGLRGEVVRLGVMSGSGFDSELLKKAACKMDESELLGFKKAFETKIDSFFPPVCQLEQIEKSEKNGSSDEFII